MLERRRSDGRREVGRGGRSEKERGGEGGTKGELDRFAFRARDIYRRETNDCESGPALRGDPPPVAFWRRARRPAGIKGKGGVELEGGGATAFSGLSSTTGAAARGRLGSVGEGDWRVGVPERSWMRLGSGKILCWAVHREEGVWEGREESKRRKEASQFYCCLVSFGLASVEARKEEKGKGMDIRPASSE